MLHAVGVAGGTGDVVALVGKSGTGKTTAATHLGRRLGYVTDETVVIEDDFSVSPYPKPLSIITDPQQSHAKIEHSPNELDLLVPPEGLRLGAVVVLVRDPDEADPRIEAIELVEAALAVLPETSALPKLAAPPTTAGRGAHPQRRTLSTCLLRDRCLLGRHRRARRA